MALTAKNKTRKGRLEKALDIARFIGWKDYEISDTWHTELDDYVKFWWSDAMPERVMRFNRDGVLQAIYPT